MSTELSKKSDGTSCFFFRCKQASAPSSARPPRLGSRRRFQSFPRRFSIGPISQFGSAASHVAKPPHYRPRDRVDVNGCHCSAASDVNVLSLSFSLSPPPICLAVSLPAAGAMANHLIPNALLRPHGTNNPYNTLLGDSAVYNNALGMYNTQGVQASSPSQSF